MTKDTIQKTGGCPVMGSAASAGGGRRNKDWWPEMLNLSVLRQHSDLSNPMGSSYNYAEEFKSLDLKISWADLFILAGNVAHDSMGFKTFGFGGGRDDVWEPAEDIYWGEEAQWLGNKQRYAGGRDESGHDSLAMPLAAVHMGLIYVNPEGPNGNPDPLESAKDIRISFGRMAMNDEETVALIAGGHTFGKCHGAASDTHVGAEPNAQPLESQALGWHSDYESGKGVHTITSGLEGAWTPNPIKWDTGYFDMLLGYEWELGKSPAGAHQWHAVGVKDEDFAPEVDGSAKKVPTMMATTDIALVKDPEYLKISKKFHEDHDYFADAYARAWYKLTHRDMGPITRYLGADTPEETLIWQDPLPEHGSAAIEKAAKDAGHDITVPFNPGRVDAGDEHTDAESFETLEPETDGFRNFAKTVYTVSAEELLVDRAHLLSLTAPEMTVLVGGMRALGANYKGTNHGVLTNAPQTLTNDFFVNLLDMRTEWKCVCPDKQGFIGVDRTSGEQKWSATRVDLIFGHDHELRAIAEVYATDDAKEKFVEDFVAAWTKVMELDRFDLDPNYNS